MSEPIGDPTTKEAEVPAVVVKDRLLIRSLDGESRVVESPRRLSHVLRLEGRIYELRSVDQRAGRWFRIYVEVRVDDIEIVSKDGP